GLARAAGGHVRRGARDGPLGRGGLGGAAAGGAAVGAGAAGGARAPAARPAPLVVMLTALVLFGRLPSSTGNYPYSYIVFPGLLWCATRFGARGVATGLLYVALLAVPATAAGRGPFAPWPPAQRTPLLQIYL